MAHFAKLDDSNVVLEVIVVNNSDILDLPFPESEAVGIAFLTSWSGGYTNWKQTSYNAEFRKHFAGIGFTYDAVRDAFIPPKEDDSWVFYEDECYWAPAERPAPRNYVWNEETNSWMDLNDAKRNW